MLEIFVQTFFLYFIVIDPLGNTPIFLSITQSMEPKQKIKIADSIGNSNNALIVPSDTAGLFGAFASLAKGYEALKPSPSSSVQNPDVK